MGHGFFRTAYKVFRSVVFTVIIAVAAIYLIAYVALSMPWVQDKMRSVAEQELSEYIGGEIRIGDLSISPFSEILLSDVIISDPSGQPVADIGTLGAGINFWRLVAKGKIEITFAELIDADIRLTKATPESPLNIDYIIKAFAPKEKNKPPTHFDLKIHNIVVRRSAVSFSRLWLPHLANNRFDFNHLHFYDVNADVELPRLRNDDFLIDLRRLAFKADGGLVVEKISCKAAITPHSLSVNNLVIALPHSDLRPADFNLAFNGYDKIGDALRTDVHSFVLVDAKIDPLDFKALYPPLANLDIPFLLSADLAGNLNGFEVRQLSIRGFDSSLSLEVEGRAETVGNLNRIKAEIGSLRLRTSRTALETILSGIPAVPEQLTDILIACGNIEMELSGSLSAADATASANGILSTDCGDLKLDLTGRRGFRRLDVEGNITANGLKLGQLLSETALGDVTLDAEFAVSVPAEGDGFFPKRLSINNLPSGKLIAEIPFIYFNGYEITGISLDATSSQNNLAAELNVADNNFTLRLNAASLLAGPASEWSINAVLDRFRPDMFIPAGKLSGYEFSGEITADAIGNSIDNLDGSLQLDNFKATGGVKGDIELNNLAVALNTGGNGEHHATLHSDWLDAEVEGVYRPSQLPLYVQNLLGQVFPVIFSYPERYKTSEDMSGTYRLRLAADSPLSSWLGMQLHWPEDVIMSGDFDSAESTFSFKTAIPYLIKGKDKLIRDTSVRLWMDGDDRLANLSLCTLYPTKKGDLRLDMDAALQADNFDIDLGFNRDRNVSFHGEMSLSGRCVRRSPDGKLEADIHVLPGSFFLNRGEWKLGDSYIRFADGKLNVTDFNLIHGNQFLDINGVAGPGEDDRMMVNLADIDLSYVFDTLNINYVSFGGFATGRLEANSLMSKHPQAFTRGLTVKDFSYNDSLLGDAEMKSRWDNSKACIEIFADIKEGKRHTATVDGGIFLKRDSLSFAFDADRMKVGFLQPFMQAFAEKVEGRASGRALLYGTFKDIDMKGRLFADSVAIKLAFTNVEYHGSDSILINPGRIEIPKFVLYDNYGHSGVLSGTLSHDYFHSPSFDFRLNAINNLLVYDTNRQLNPDWYGRIFATGTGSVTGQPGYVRVAADVVTEKKSDFTFVLNDRLEAGDYQFLSFTDRRKEAMIRAAEEAATPTFLQTLTKLQKQVEGPPTIFAMDLRVDVTPDARLTLVMDPVGGDKITAYGSGSMNIGYDSASDEMKMLGRYTLSEGTYNFTLQDLILKDFTIRPGSDISFNGDPMDADLDITAAYRVNTNLTDLDKSFAQDKELNRTNVPVDALLKVTGDMQNPNIDFDIDLPTLTEETSRKVKSIISTEDMMSRQIIYLLALNRFYTPEYMGVSSNGGEWASVASSTLSSQLSNMLGQLTDKVNLMPSLRSDKGDFSDVEVDVALSSRLLNNRLLINGNFGYRDRSTSNTTFVGDFDIEYLLNRNGNLRLKAYNHFNDQNYYLKSSLTTQGIGIIYRKEFDNPFSFLRRGKKKPKGKVEIQDSIPVEM